MTVHSEKSDSISKESTNRRAMSESDVRQDSSDHSVDNLSATRAKNANNVVNDANDFNHVEFQVQKRSHSLPHRYKIPHPNLSGMMSSTNRGNVVTPTRQKCVSPQEFRRGVQAMQSWFHNLNDNQRTLALQSIAVSSCRNFFKIIRHVI